jgi:hypothetical protein
MWNQNSKNARTPTPLIAAAAVGAACLWLGTARPVAADGFGFSTGDPDGKLAAGSRPGTSGKIEIESADDFVTTQETLIQGASFTGLLTGGATTTNVGQVTVEIYRVFPLDSTNPPSGSVPTRVNSPSDNAFDSRDALSNTLTFNTTVLSSLFSTNNSILNGINKLPNQTTGGEGPTRGQEVRFDATFATPFDLPTGHYFFVPQVEVTQPDGEFMWLSAPKPIVSPGTPFAPDLQSWIRDANLDPDWLRMGTDIIGGQPAPTFNMSFSLNEEVVPEPASLALFGTGMVMLAMRRRRRPS